MNERTYVFGESTARHLSLALAGLLVAGAPGLTLWAVLGWRASRMGATLSLMGAAIGASIGLVTLGWLKRRPIVQADRVALLNLALLMLPLAMLPVQLGGGEFLGWRGWLAVLFQAACAVPFGAAFTLGISLILPTVKGWNNRFWLLTGCGLGFLVSFGAMWLMQHISGAFLINLFAAPLMWPAIPYKGERSLLARMLLTMMVVVSFAALLLMS